MNREELCNLNSWLRHQMETFSTLLAICAGNSPASGEFPAQRPMTRSFDVFFDLCLNKRFSEQSRGWWFVTLSGPLWRHRNVWQLVIGAHVFMLTVLYICGPKYGGHCTCRCPNTYGVRPSAGTLLTAILNIIFQSTFIYSLRRIHWRWPKVFIMMI